MKKRRKLLLFASAAALLALAVAFAARYSKPEGMFADPAIASEQFAYWEFKDGSISIITPWTTNNVGQYFRKDDRWACGAVATGGSYSYLESSILGFRLVHSNGAIALPVRKRIFIRPTPLKEREHQQ